VAAASQMTALSGDCSSSVGSGLRSEQERRSGAYCETKRDACGERGDGVATSVQVGLLTNRFQCPKSALA